MAYVAMQKTEICDLHISMTGSKTLVKLKRGDLVPVEFLDASDVKKSLAFGALGRLLRAGIVKEVPDEEAAELSANVSAIRLPSEKELPKVISPIAIPSKARSQELVSEVSAKELHEMRQDKGMVQSVEMTMPAGGNGAAEAVAFEMGVATRGGGIGMVVAEKRPELGETHDAVVDANGKVREVKDTIGDYETKADLSKVKTYADFETLNHFDKLIGIKTFTDKALLTEIADKSQVKQIKNVSAKRIAELV